MKAKVKVRKSDKLRISKQKQKTHVRIWRLGRWWTRRPWTPVERRTVAAGDSACWTSPFEVGRRHSRTRRRRAATPAAAAAEGPSAADDDDCQSVVW